MVLIGDACHPITPFAAQGAAMSVEDGAVLGKLLGLLQDSRRNSCYLSIPQVLSFFEGLRKPRTTSVAQLSADCERLFQMHDENEIRQRNELVKMIDWESEDNKFPWLWGDTKFQHALLGADVLKQAEEAFFKEFGS